MRGLSGVLAFTLSVFKTMQDSPLALLLTTGTAPPNDSALKSFRNLFTPDFCKLNVANIRNEDMSSGFPEGFKLASNSAEIRDERLNLGERARLAPVPGPYPLRRAGFQALSLAEYRSNGCCGGGLCTKAVQITNLSLNDDLRLRRSLL